MLNLHLLYEACPACGCAAGRVLRTTSGMEEYVIQCDGCEAIFGKVTNAMADRFVRMVWSEEETPTDALRYFDFTYFDGHRLHGWFDVRTRKVVQMG